MKKLLLISTLSLALLAPSARAWHHDDDDGYRDSRRYSRHSRFIVIDDYRDRRGYYRDRDYRRSYDDGCSYRRTYRRAHFTPLFSLFFGN